MKFRSLSIFQVSDPPWTRRFSLTQGHFKEGCPVLEILLEAPWRCPQVCQEGFKEKCVLLMLEVHKQLHWLLVSLVEISIAGHSWSQYPSWRPPSNGFVIRRVIFHQSCAMRQSKKAKELYMSQNHTTTWHPPPAFWITYTWSIPGNTYSVLCFCNSWCEGAYHQNLDCHNV